MLAVGFDALSGILGLFNASIRVTTLNKVMVTRANEASKTLPLLSLLIILLGNRALLQPYLICLG
jgi:hypothetical protein